MRRISKFPYPSASHERLDADHGRRVDDGAQLGIARAATPGLFAEGWFEARDLTYPYGRGGCCRGDR
jgi:hypothetical protein